MDYRDGWEKSKQRLIAFWNREIIDRCCVAVHSPKKGRKHIDWEDFPTDNMEDKIKYWTDGESILKRKRVEFESMYFGGEATPQIPVQLGVSAHAGFFKNARYQFESTVWFFPSLSNLEDLAFDPESFIYKKTFELAKYITAESKGSFLVSLQDYTGNADALAHLRGSENLLMDMLDDEHAVQKALQKIQDAWVKVISQGYDIIKENNEGGGTLHWLRTWAPGLHSQLQCDMSVMISPNDFNKYIMPELRAQSDYLEYPLYHFDGIEQLRHLDSLLSIEKLKAIQWTQVEGQPSALEYIPALKRIQEAGKCLIIFVTPEQVEPLMEQLSSKGLYLLLDAESQEDAEEIIKKVEKLTHE